MVCDIRGFTAATEIFSKSDLAQTLGHWFREATHLVQQGGGHIDKFVGDSFLAYWVKQETGPSECEAAFDAGCKLLELAKATTWPDPGRPFQIVVALHCGQVAYRNIGVVAERDASIIGDAVNTVFRLESLTKELGQQLLTSREFLAALPSTDAFTDMGERMLKGKSHPVQVFGYNS
jgi:adenylate cyclase